MTPHPIQRRLLMCWHRNLIPAVALLCAATSVPERALAQITAIDTGAMTWERADTDTPGFPDGAMRKLLKIDQETGIGAALRWHPEGYVEPRHYHTTAAHSIYVLEGKLDVGGVEAGPGHFFHFPAYTAHGPLVALEDVVFLIWSEGPLDLELGDPPNGEKEERVHSASSETSLREAEVIAVAQAYLRALSDRDGATLRALSLPGGSVHAVDLADDGSLWRIRSRSLEDDAVKISEDSDPLLERMWDPIAMVHGRLAMVWTPYDFWVAGEWSHCGIDIFTLVETDDGWKVSSISYTSEVSDCPESPLPPPTAEELGVNQ
jgi:hypothetical protein